MKVLGNNGGCRTEIIGLKEERWMGQSCDKSGQQQDCQARYLHPRERRDPV